VPSVSAIILAAGASTRMGTQKALLPWEGTTLIEYELDQLASLDAVREIVVVTGHEPERISVIAAASARARAVQNDAYKSGKASSIKTGMAAVSDDADAIMLCAVDQPRTSSILRRLIDAHLASDAPITLPVYRGRRGHPVIFSAELRDDLAAIEEGTQGVRAVLHRHATEVAAVEIDDAAVLLDLNTPEDVPEGV